MYANRLMSTELGAELLKNHFDNFVNRLGAYIGQVIKNHIAQDFYWYEASSVYNYSPNLDGADRNTKVQSVLYSKKKDILISPLNVASQCLKGSSPYSSFLTYVEEMIEQHS